ncbi:MotA/TolQ/ExbB proton channel family protein [Erythrobacter sp. Alg231-14]|uniref:MotA/TolQ/ExbB proton channel family protein n=1 Tax=Erythrobacter sp. Alg231-14 TaxID=1922225 RepID=UPI000D54CFCF
MLHEAVAFWDLGALVIVLAGTLLATTARCGWRDMAVAIRSIARIHAPDFDADVNRASMARCAPEIRQRGHLCAQSPLPPDPSMAKLIQSYLISGSIEEFHATARAQRSQREIIRAQGMRVFEYAGELAPIFGLVGTLFAITQINDTTGTTTTQAMMATVGTAVLSSLYGVLTAHLFCAPLAAAIERRGSREETARAGLIEWFEAELVGQHAVNLHKATTKTPLPRTKAPVRLQDVA